MRISGRPNLVEDAASSEEQGFKLKFCVGTEYLQSLGSASALRKSSLSNAIALWAI